MAAASPTLTKPPILYHYTSIHGVLGILKSRSIWATMLHFMNDSREWLYALDLVRQDLRDRREERRDAYWLLFLSELSEALTNIEGMYIYVSSFSASANQLSQWRAYCPPEGGYELSFDVGVLEAHLDRHQFKLQPCIYEPGDHRKVVNDIVSPIIAQVGILADEATVGQEKIRILQMLKDELRVTAPVLKHPDFREEKEWRAHSLVLAHDVRMNYHIKGAILVPHCVLGLETETSKFPLIRITVGPSAYQVMAEKGLEWLSFKYNIQIDTSSTPLRGF